jgi:hypothetical protein
VVAAAPVAPPEPIAEPVAPPQVAHDTPPSGTPAVPPPAVTPARPGGAVPGKRPINPFLSADPGMKAKRLARALVSDMIAYLPQKREEGLKNGTLKQLFREEIKKSYEEYVEQIGKEMADSTSHFQDALNDILADGGKIF